MRVDKHSSGKDPQPAAHTHAPPPDMSSKFSDNWRKRRACERCRRNKVRCEYDSPVAAVCRRCAKAGAECIVSDGKLAADGTLMVHDVALRIRYLEKIVSEAQAEIAALGAAWKSDFTMGSTQLSTPETLALESSSTSHKSPPNIDWAEILSGSKYPVLDFDFDSKVETNYMDFAIRVGMITRRAAALHYARFANEMDEFMPAQIQQYRNFDQASENEPTMTLVAVTAAASSVNDDVIMLTKFVEQVFTEKAQLRTDCATLDFAKAVLIVVLYFPSGAWNIKSPRVLSIIYMVFTTLEAFSPEREADALMAAVPLSQEFQDHKYRIIILLGMVVCVLSVSITSNNMSDMAFLPGVEKACTALLSHGTPIERTLAYLDKCLVHTREMLIFLDSLPKGVTIIDVEAQFSEKRAWLGGLVASMEMSIPAERRDENCYTVLSSSLYQGLVVYSDRTINHIVSNYRGTESERTLLIEQTNELVRRSLRLVDQFEHVCRRPPVFPRFIYFRPLIALSAMIRVRLIYWWMGFTETIDVNSVFIRVKTAWEQASIESATAARMHQAFFKLEQWINLVQSGVIVCPGTDNPIGATLNTVLQTVLEMPPANAANAGPEHAPDMGPDMLAFSSSSDKTTTPLFQSPPSTGSEFTTSSASPAMDNVNTVLGMDTSSHSNSSHNSHNSSNNSHNSHNSHNSSNNSHNSSHGNSSSLGKFDFGDLDGDVHMNPLATSYTDVEQLIRELFEK